MVYHNSYEIGYPKQPRLFSLLKCQQEIIDVTPSLIPHFQRVKTQQGLQGGTYLQGACCFVGTKKSVSVAFFVWRETGLLVLFGGVSNS